MQQSRKRSAADAPSLQLAEEGIHGAATARDPLLLLAAKDLPQAYQ